LSPGDQITNLPGADTGGAAAVDGDASDGAGDAADADAAADPPADADAVVSFCVVAPPQLAKITLTMSSPMPPTLLRRHHLFCVLMLVPP
jgi:TctA family transporter